MEGKPQLPPGPFSPPDSQRRATGCDQQVPPPRPGHLFSEARSRLPLFLGAQTAFWTLLLTAASRLSTCLLLHSAEPKGRDGVFASASPTPQGLTRCVRMFPASTYRPTGQTRDMPERIFVPSPAQHKPWSFGYASRSLHSRLREHDDEPDRQTKFLLLQSLHLKKSGNIKCHVDSETVTKQESWKESKEGRLV